MILINILCYVFDSLWFSRCLGFIKFESVCLICWKWVFVFSDNWTNVLKNNASFLHFEIKHRVRLHCFFLHFIENKRRLKLQTSLILTSHEFKTGKHKHTAMIRLLTIFWITHCQCGTCIIQWLCISLVCFIIEKLLPIAWFSNVIYNGVNTSSLKTMTSKTAQINVGGTVFCTKLHHSSGTRETMT